MPLKTYRETRDPNVLYSVADQCYFQLTSPHPLAVEFEKLKASSEAEVLPLLVPTVAEKRKGAYRRAAITTDEMIVALWELVVEGRSEKAEAIQAERLRIKAEVKSE
jgi:hypothetical protein